VRVARLPVPGDYRRTVLLAWR